jgi:hypothetical protein
VIDTEIAAVLEAFLTHRHQAVTIAKRVAIGTQVVDALIIEATAEAAIWYGLEHAHQLTGRWISLLHHPDDAQLGRVLSAARHHGIAVPKAYVSRIRQGKTNQYREVMKHTTQIDVGPETYWITVLSEPKGPPLALESHRYASLLPPAPDAEKFYGKMSVADLDATLLTLDSSFAPLDHLPYSTRCSSEKARVFSVASEPQSPRAFHIALGETIILASGVYAHRCARCTHIWISGHADPPRCGKRPCQQYPWREVAERFRLLEKQGYTITPEMIRANRRRRLSRHQP